MRVCVPFTTLAVAFLALSCSATEIKEITASVARSGTAQRTEEFWDSLSNIVTTHFVSDQELLIECGMFRLNPAAPHAQPRADAARTSEEEGGPRATVNHNVFKDQHTLQQRATDFGINITQYNLNDQSDIAALRVDVAIAEERHERLTNPETGLYVARPDIMGGYRYIPNERGRKMIRDRQRGESQTRQPTRGATAAPLTKQQVDKYDKGFVDLAFSTAIAIDELDASESDKLLASYATDVSVMLRRLALARSETNALFHKALLGGAKDEWEAALRKRNSLQTEFQELVFVTGPELQVRIGRLYEIALGPVVRYSKEQRKLFDGETIKPVAAPR